MRILGVFGAAIGAALAGLPAAHAQVPQVDPNRLPEFRGIPVILGWRDARGIPEAELPKVRELFQQFAAYQAQLVSHPLVYRRMRDPLLRSDAVGRTIPTLDDIFRDLERVLIHPTPISKWSRDQADYIREMGTALDAALLPLITSHPERIVRINATRMLALVCKMGATVHYASVTGLIAGPNVPPEIRHYALQAAANLLSAYDVLDYKSRRHSNGWRNDVKPGDADRELGALVAAIEKCISDPNALIPGVLPANGTLPTDQVDVIRLMRRQAIRALAQVRFVTVPGPDGKSRLYPAFTLARVCVSDPALRVPPAPVDCAEAVIGICNMSPVIDGKPVKDYNVDAAVEAILAGLTTFAEPRGDLNDRSVHWRAYGLRIGQALYNWRPLFDYLYDPTQPRQFRTEAVPKIVNDLIQRVEIALLKPLDSVRPDGTPDPLTGQIQLNNLRQFLQQLQSNPKRNPRLFLNDPTTTLPSPKAG